MTTIQPDGGFTPATSRPDPTPTPMISSDFETFLTMLTTQLQHQDPLNPVESTDFAVQLATFSGVEQQVRTNDLLAALGAQEQTGSLAQLSEWIGREARSAGPVAFTGAPIELHLAPPATADRLTLQVADATGRIVQSVPVLPGEDSVHWAGVDADGTPLPPGSYTLTLLPEAGDAPLAAVPVESYATVREVRSGTNGPEIVLEGGQIRAAEAVSALRASGS